MRPDAPSRRWPDTPWHPVLTASLTELTSAYVTRDLTQALRVWSHESSCVRSLGRAMPSLDSMTGCTLRVRSLRLIASLRSWPMQPTCYNWLDTPRVSPVTPALESSRVTASVRLNGLNGRLNGCYTVNGDKLFCLGGKRKIKRFTV
jgi:hypothetical protein